MIILKKVVNTHSGVLLKHEKDWNNAICMDCMGDLKIIILSELWFSDVQAGFRKGRGTRDQIANIRWITEKAREFQKNIYFCFIDYAKQSLWLWGSQRGWGCS